MMSREDAIKWFHDELQERCLPEDKQNAYEEALYALNGASIREDFDVIDDVARHFYEFGKLSRPKESDSLEELEREVIKFWNDHSLEYRLGRVADIDFLHLCARHFADWGSKHLKK